MKIGKKIGVLSIFTLVSAVLFAQKPVHITGVSNMEYKRPVHVYKVENGQPVSIADAQVNKDGKFGFIFYPEYEGLYVVGSSDDRNPLYSFNFWFKEGDHLSFTFDEFGYELDKKGNSKENKIMYEWELLSKTLRQQSFEFARFPATYIEFFPALEQTVAKAKDWAKGKKTGNAKFDNQLNWMMQHDLAFYATNFLYTPRKVFPTEADMIPYYETIGVRETYRNTADVYRYPWGKRALNGRLMYEMKKKNIKPGGDIQSIKAILDFIPNDTLKGDYVLEQLSRIKTYKEYTSITADLGKYILTEAQQSRNISMLSPLMAFKEGDSGFNFNLEDAGGKMVSLADLKGKIVLVDVWATWCAPCKAEIPYLKKLEEELSGTDLQVVGISLDEDKDKVKWATMIKDEKLGGIQLYTGGWQSQFAQYYGIKAIPRFMVFDREGKIINVSAPRPSSPELKNLLLKHLK
ncbi:TlpA disulfide reductase family protein [Sphingobacterium lumbrici]|uniref:TlpA disulfide reductase family protein n=1 Tax=Sphingobacterium lumbrici TaxID=2559600 RepID=UPI00112EF560|nr:TlpA disulfide reductase family protein [Sphingobacterium lumbrici]